MAEPALTQALVPANGSLPSTEDFTRAEHKLDIILEQGDSEGLFGVATASQAASLYHERNKHKEAANSFMRLKVLAEAGIGCIDLETCPARNYQRSRPLVIGGEKIGDNFRREWRRLGIAHQRGLLNAMLRELVSADEGLGRQALLDAVGRSGVLWTPAAPIRKAFEQSGLTYSEVARIAGYTDCHPARKVLEPNGPIAIHFTRAKRLAVALGIDVMSLPTFSRSQSVDELRRRRAERERRRSAERRALKQKERDDAIKQAVRKAGGAAAELYAMAERMQDVLGQAHREASDPQRRQAFSLAGEHYRKMRDEIARGFLAVA